ncbi:type IV secretory system conjugative DNA transfer family protein [Thioalkalivibrio thiocyanodenitrificans]|uniref:type IV secretory system conjugative DNA transfer family protein n=1 Tax=Thioalkalivibrio thiocyanodenitrificans TaxID=243063 RepID=UPI000368FC82|nr:TraM recognition domain-containing protein [Thioalkalivibrio thiocyanodenitrificans]
MPLVGPKDASALLGLSSAALASLPQFAGMPLTAAAMAGGGLGAAWLGYRRSRKWLDRTDLVSREGFILPSDETFPETLGFDGLRVGYTRDHSRPVDIANGFLTRHLAIIGQSGVGKTTLGEYMLWSQAARGGGFIFIDAKLDVETRDKLAYMMKLLGREEDLFILNVDEPHNSNTYNPILSGDADEVSSRLLNLLPSSENNIGADFYKQQANQALTVITAALKKAGCRYHFGDLSIIMQSARAIESLERMIPEGSQEKRALQVFLDQFRRKTKDGSQVDINKLKEVLGGMAGRIAMFAQGKFGQVLNTYTPEIDLTDCILNNKVVYIMLPTMGKDVAALNLGKMVLSDVRTATYNIQGTPKYRRPAPPYLIFADEMGSYVMPGIARLFEQARSANICMIPAFQSFANLSVVSPDFADMIIQNTWSKVLFKFGSKDSPEMAADIIGKSSTFQYSLSVSENDTESSPLLRTVPQLAESHGGGLGESWREEEGYRVSPDQLKSLGIGESVVMSGARMFHIKTPMLEFPEEVPVYKVTRHPRQMPKEERGLEYEHRYREFLMDTGDPDE